MKTERNILIAFILNLAFAVFEFFGGIFTGSVAIISDAVHDMGDAASIGLSYFLEKKSKFPISLAIPAAVSIAVGVAIFLAPILIKNTPEEERA